MIFINTHHHWDDDYHRTHILYQGTQLQLIFRAQRHDIIKVDEFACEPNSHQGRVSRDLLIRCGGENGLLPFSLYVRCRKRGVKKSLKT